MSSISEQQQFDAIDREATPVEAVANEFVKLILAPGPIEPSADRAPGTEQNLKTVVNLKQ